MSKKISDYRSLMASARKEVSKAKMKKKEIRSECSHRDRKGRFNIRRLKGKKDVFKCRECGTKIDFRELAALDGKRESIEKYIHEIFKAHRNILNLSKLFHNKKEDPKVLKYMSNMIFGDYRLEDYLIALIADEFVPHRKKKKGGKKKKKGGRGRLMSGGRSLGRHRR